MTQPLFHLRRIEFVESRLPFEDGTPPDADRTFSPPLEDLTETPEQRARFLIRLKFCVALFGFGVITLLHGMGEL